MERAERSLRCAFIGDEALVAQCIQIAQAHGLVPVLVATTSPIVRDFAAAEHIPTVGHGAELVAGLDHHPADVLFSIANLRVLSDDVLAQVATAINFHDGPLPGYAGLNVTTWAILNGEREHAITWHQITGDVDGGDVVATERFPIEDEETAFSLNARCYEAALATFPTVAAAVAAGHLDAHAQLHGERRTFSRHDRPALLLDPTRASVVSAREVRALDVGPRIANTVGSVRWILGEDPYVVTAARVHEEATGAEPGTVVALDGDGVRMATVDGDLVVSALATPEGSPVDVAAVLTAHGVQVGEVAQSASPALQASVAELEPRLARDESFWLDRLTVAEPSSPPLFSRAGDSRATRTIPLATGVDTAAALAAVSLWIARTTGLESVSFALTDASSRALLERVAPLARPGVVTVPIIARATFAELHSAVAAEVEATRERSVLLRDAIGRDPRTRGQAGVWPVLVELDGAGAAGSSFWADGTALHVAIRDDSLVLDAVVDPADPDAIERAGEELSTLITEAMRDPSARCDSLPLLDPAELALLDATNRTALDHDRSATIDALFDAQVRHTPSAPALSFGDVTLSYLELHERVQSLAGRLSAAGITRGDRVGIATERNVEMVVGVLSTLALGASYVPLDPTYPTERLAFMAGDAGIAALLAESDTARALCPPGAAVIDPAEPQGHLVAPPAPSHVPSDLAYVIYTSGSTGSPKGVMLEHRNVTNFFAAMDQVIDHDPPGVWLAVTSLSFDISVLELLWTLTRGFHVVLKADRGGPAVGSVSPLEPPAASTRPISFSLFYFAAGDDAAADGYRLLLESARFADRNGFEAVWTPERHFHAFGGAYPNPSVTGAALAAITENVGIRAGSVVLPLHSPIRVAEEWAVVDNLSRGRVAVSFAAGWQPNDFALNPSAFATAKRDLPRNIETVKRLWRGETVMLPGHDGENVEVRTLPRPVQAELPIWLTSAGSPATFERAGTLGANVLTHLLGQSVAEVTENIVRYRTAWREAGHEGEGRVTLMLHTYLERDAANARSVALDPMKEYLRTSVGLLRNVASAFPTFTGAGKDADDLFASLSARELDQLLEMAAHRYIDTSGLFGTPDDVAAFVRALAAAGVDEVACLIDFGVGTDDALASLELLLEAKHKVDARPMSSVAGPRDDSVAALTARHGVTHLQCTPSLAAMLAADPLDREALRSISHLMVGGEALPTALASELRGVLPRRFTNMYGPTETTIWSLTHELAEPLPAAIPIGRPIANTTVFVLDPAGNRVPFGTFGELHIGGEGVARGYHDRVELTAERFVDRRGMGRVYATGDVVRLHRNGEIEFAGRADNQVKIRGHRIELGEIESVLDAHPAVTQSVVVARADDSDTRLVAYVVVGSGTAPSSHALRDHVAAILPSIMVPSAVVCLDAFPLTPNGKIDRKALPADRAIDSARLAPITAPPVDDTEKLVAGIWADELGVSVGRDDNFFDVGGHSLLAVKVFRRVCDATDAPLALTDVFRFPTVRTIAAHISALQGSETLEPAARSLGGATGVDRGAMRRRVLAHRGRGVTQGDGR